MMKDISRISLVCSFAIFQARNDPVWSSPRLVTQHIDGVPTGELVGTPLPPKKQKQKQKLKTKTKARG
jgi:hypothetical protein